jgi:hypothetical protein
MRLPTRSEGVIVLIAVLAYLPGFWWGAPHATAEDRRKAWGVDDEPPLGPLAQLKDMLTPGVAPDANLGYPMMHSYLVIGTYAPYLGALAVTGKLSSPTAEYPYGFSDPVAALRNLTLIAHFLSVLLGAGIVLAAYWIGRTFWGERTGWWAAAFTLLSYPMFYYSRTSNVDVPVLFFAAWSLVALARALTAGVTTRRLVAFGVLAGFAVATKEPMAALYVGLPLTLFAPTNQWAGYRAPAALLRALAITAAGAFVAYAIGSGMVLDFARWKAHIAAGVSVTSNASTGSIAFMTSYPWTISGHWALLSELTSKLGHALTVPGLLLSIVGVVMAVRRQRTTVWLLVAVTTYLLVLFLAVRAVQLRYIMPASFVLGLFAAFAARELVVSSRALVRAGGIVATAAAAIMAIAWAANLTHAMVRDSRYAAGEWLLATARQGDRIEYFGAFQKNPPLPAWVQTSLAAPYAGGAFEPPRDDSTAAAIQAGWAARKPRFILLTPDHTSRDGEPYARSCPPQVFAALESGTAGYVRARLFQTPPLIRLLPRPRLDYGAVNPPVTIYVAAGDSAAGGAQ